MRIIFDQGTPVPIRSYLELHTVRTAAQQGWDKLTNGDLLTAAEEAGFDLLLTTDKNMRYQQNLAAGKSRSWSSANSNGRNFARTSSASLKRLMRSNQVPT